jgi:hypothetical protein
MRHPDSGFWVRYAGMAPVNEETDPPPCRVYRRVKVFGNAITVALVAAGYRPRWFGPNFLRIAWHPEPCIGGVSPDALRVSIPRQSLYQPQALRTIKSSSS